MYVFGGVDANRRRRNNLHKMWMRAPSLKEQAWIKLVEHLKSKDLLTKEVLIKMGVPSNFYPRLDDTVEKLTQAA